jgi:phosphatidylserine decarboxylase
LVPTTLGFIVDGHIQYAPTKKRFGVDGHVQQIQTVFGPDNELGERKVRPYKSVFFS